MKICYQRENWLEQFGEPLEYNQCGSCDHKGEIWYCTLDVEKFGYPHFNCGNWKNNLSYGEQITLF